MINPIDSSSSVGNKFDSLLSNLSTHSNIKLTEKAEDKEKTVKTDIFEKTFDPGKIEDALEKLIEDKNLKVKFSTDEKTDKLVLKIIDKESDEIVRQYPPEISLKISRIVNDLMENDGMTDVKI